MTSRCTAAASPIATRWLIWLLLVVLPLQGMAAVVAELRGPSHRHAASEELWIPQMSVRHSLAPMQHAHAHANAERHHHARSDTTVIEVPSADGAEAIAVDDGSNSGGSGGTFLALIPSAHAAPPFEARNSLHAADPGSFQTRYPGRLERPPARG